MKIQEYVKRLLAHAGVSDVEVKVEEDEAEIRVQLLASESETGMIIGYHGEGLAALQRIIRIIFKDETPKRIVLDVNNYRQQRVEKIQTMVTQIAKKVLETNQPYTFSYLPANERFIIHSSLSEHSEFSNLESISEGEGFDRRLIIRLKKT